MSKTLLIVAVIAVMIVATTVASAVPPPKVHAVPVVVDATYEAAGPYLVITFTTEKHGSDLAVVRCAVTPTATNSFTTELVGDYYVTTLRILVAGGYHRGTEFTVNYRIRQTAGKSGVSFVGDASITTSIRDLLPS